MYLTTLLAVLGVISIHVRLSCAVFIPADSNPPPVHSRWKYLEGSVSVHKSYRFPSAPMFGPVEHIEDWACFRSSSTNATRCMPPGLYRIDRAEGKYNFTWSTVDTYIPPASKSPMLMFGSDEATINGKTSPVRLTAFTDRQGPGSMFAHNITDYLSGSATPKPCFIFIHETKVNITRVPSVCIWSKEKYDGDFVCFGPGAGRLPDGIAQTANSLKVRINAVEGWFSSDPVKHSRVGESHKFFPHQMQDQGVWRGGSIAFDPPLNGTLTELHLL
ncbi:MAG: hypothetical protein M1838_001127 [Thelocarpon superellum]|nr:MAG: hypothetical protein M1838_001127 [Thelocarpon superellum]